LAAEFFPFYIPVPRLDEISAARRHHLPPREPLV
jgi:hypothetical protein